MTTSIQNYETQRIGLIPLGIDGSDEYLLVTDRDGDIDIEAVRQEYLEQHYRDTDTPGGYFCRAVTVAKLPADNRCIVIVHHRFDV